MDPLEMAVKVATFFVPFLFSLCFHEFAHGYVAKLYGDNTAEMMGRLTLNPIPHMDPIGTVAFPILAIMTGIPYLFGWAKPVPVNPRNLRDPKNGMFWVAFAGPLSNILLFLIGLVAFAILVHVVQLPFQSPFYSVLTTFLSVNLLLAFFNLLPLHPLDGGKILARFIPRQWNNWLEENQSYLQMALFALIIFRGFEFLAIPIQGIMSTSLTMIAAAGGA